MPYFENRVLLIKLVRFLIFKSGVVYAIFLSRVFISF